jgi:hypothetical protein
MMLLRDGKARLSGARAAKRFINFLNESAPQSVEYRQGGANNSVRQEIDPILAGRHLRVLRVLRFHSLCLLPAQPFQTVNASIRPRSDGVYRGSDAGRTDRARPLNPPHSAVIPPLASSETRNRIAGTSPRPCPDASAWCLVCRRSDRSAVKQARFSPRRT